jgi:hypothetical protein
MLQPEFSRLLRFFSAKILDDDWSIFEITVWDWLICAEEKSAVNEKTQAVCFLSFSPSEVKI